MNLVSVPHVSKPRPLASLVRAPVSGRLLLFLRFVEIRFRVDLLENALPQVPIEDLPLSLVRAPEALDPVDHLVLIVHPMFRRFRSGWRMLVVVLPVFVLDRVPVPDPISGLVVHPVSDEVDALEHPPDQRPLSAPFHDPDLILLDEYISGIGQSGQIGRVRTMDRITWSVGTHQSPISSQPPISRAVVILQWRWEKEWK